MKKLILLITIFPILTLSASRTEEPLTKQEQRDFKLTITNHKGRPVRNINILAYHTGDKKNIVKFDRKGNASLQNVTDRDTLYVVFNRGYYSIPIEDMDSLYLIVKNRHLLSNNPKLDEVIDNGYIKVSKDANVFPAEVVSLRDAMGYTNLAEYLMGRVAGLIITQEGSGGSYTALIRGPKSLFSSNEPLVIVDGTQMSSFDHAVQMVNVSDISSVNVLKDGAMYGSRGANGVIVIKTKSGRER